MSDEGVILAALILTAGAVYLGVQIADATDEIRRVRSVGLGGLLQGSG